MLQLRVFVIEAENLMPADFFSKQADPYVKVTVGKEVHQTTIQKKTLNPHWKEELRFTIDSHNLPSIKFEVYDWDRFKTDDFLGTCQLPLKMPINGDVWLKLSIQGKIHVKLETFKGIQQYYPSFQNGQNGIALKVMDESTPTLYPTQQFNPNSFGLHIDKNEASKFKPKRFINPQSDSYISSTENFNVSHPFEQDSVGCSYYALSCGKYVQYYGPLPSVPP
ncbi:C2 domain containing protein kinase C region 2, putative [Entamoeba histolytica HM-1:IMSS-B]|nr:C2 domain containing protein kinase C region 2, putative [Entamoeba histolytica HM-1:IMSS-B]EMS16201.1 C2 domain containing protein kinase C, putative [Entamoeba histolytica HM-3:IMSS]GAT95159.1 c2 domain containing protein [Entamoeba histolytica]